MLSGTSFCNILQITLELEFIDTLMHRLTILGTFFHGALSTTRRTRTLQITKPCLALYPRRL